MAARYDVRADLLLSTGRHSLRADVLYRDRITITRARRAESSVSAPTSVDLRIKNPDGRYSPRNPLSPLYGLIGRNTQAQVYLGAPHLGEGGGTGTASTSHVAPSVTATTDGLLISGWMSVDVVTYTAPGSMTTGSDEAGVDATMLTAYEEITAGATGTRTATSSDSKGYASVSAVIHGANATIEEILTHTPTTDPGLLETVTITTDDATQAGWWLVAVQGWLVDVDMPMPDAPYGDDGGWIPLADSGRIDADNFFSTGVYLRQRIWARRVSYGGAQRVIFGGDAGAPTGFATNLAALYVLSGIDDWDVRATVEIPAWPSRWDISGSHVWVPIEGAGILRRLQQGSSPLESPMRRALTGAGPAASWGTSLLPVAYWPLEDAAGTQAASGLPGGASLTATDTIQWGSVTVTGSAPLPDWSAGPGHLVGPATGVTGDSWGVGCLVQYTGATSWDALRIAVQGGPYSELRLILGASSVAVHGVHATGVTTLLSDTTDLSDGQPHWVEIRATDKDVFGAGTFVYWLHLDGVQVVSSGTVSGAPGAPVTVRPQRRGSDTAALGHLGIWDSPPLDSIYYLLVEPAMRAHAGETAGRRIVRLCQEQDIPVHVVGDPDDTVEMGEQPVASLLTLLREAEEADLGILYEPRGVLGLAYRTRTSRYNQPATLALRYGDEGEVAPPLEPTDDDRYASNAVTVTRSGGSSYRYEVTSGPLSTADPPDGVGIYDHSVTISILSDALLPDQASARAHLGTVDELRYPTVRVDLRRLDELGKQQLSSAAAALDPGDRLTIDGAPDWLPPDVIDQHVEGCTETLGTYVRDLSLVCVPATPYTVGVVEDDVLGRADTDGMELAADFVAGTDTSMSVTVTAGPDPILTSTHPSMLDFDIKCGGVVLEVTGISGSGPFTFTITQTPVNGVTKTIPAGTPLSLANPWRAAL